jgi:diaminopimelate epimerase
MTIAFKKFHGTGNDFIITDIRNHAISDEPDIIAGLCDRHMGIGADGLIMLDNSEGYDFEMRYFNADGHEASMCGNGGRCVLAYASLLGIISRDARFMAADGIHTGSIISETGIRYIVELGMQDVSIPDKQQEDQLFLKTGSPHLVIKTKNLDTLDVFHEGRKLRYDKRFGSGGTNVTFLEERQSSLHIRTYERGVEDETRSCGTGATAAALAWAVWHGKHEGPVSVSTRGGPLLVGFRRKDSLFTDVSLEGPAAYVFSGEINI